MIEKRPRERVTDLGVIVTPEGYRRTRNTGSPLIGAGVPSGLPLISDVRRPLTDDPNRVGEARECRSDSRPPGMCQLGRSGSHG